MTCGNGMKPYEVAVGVTILLLGMGMGLALQSVADSMTASERLVYEARYNSYTLYAMLGFFVGAIGIYITVAGVISKSERSIEPHSQREYGLTDLKARSEFMSLEPAVSAFCSGCGNQVVGAISCPNCGRILQR